MKSWMVALMAVAVFAAFSVPAVAQGKGKGDNKDDKHSGKVDQKGDGNSGQGNDLHKKDKPGKDDDCCERKHYEEKHEHKCEKKHEEHRKHECCKTPWKEGANCKCACHHKRHYQPKGDASHNDQRHDQKPPQTKPPEKKHHG